MLLNNGYIITTPSDDVIEMQCPLLDRKWSRALSGVHIDWKELAQWEHGSRMISRGIAHCKALHWSSTIPRHYSAWPIKTWVGKHANNIMLVWVLWQVKTVTCPWMGHVCNNHTSGVKPHNRSSYSETYGKLMPCEVSNDKEIICGTRH